MKTTDNTTTLVLRQLTQDFAASDNSGEQANILERIVAVICNVEAQRDSLLAACKLMLSWYDSGENSTDLTRAVDLARAAIAASQGS